MDFTRLAMNWRILLYGERLRFFNCAKVVKGVKTVMAKDFAAANGLDRRSEKGFLANLAD